MNRISILTGNYGSGKTEIALEMARRLAAKGRTALVDLDIVNPYFRSSTQRQALEALGVKVYAPNFAGTNLDLPSLPGEIIAVFEDPDVQVVFDVGGDATGAAALGRYHRYFEREGYELLYVVNACRPLSGTPEEIAGLLDIPAATVRTRLRRARNKLHDRLGGDDHEDRVSEVDGAYPAPRRAE